MFVGGSLVDIGGHNILEPAVFGKPIVFGPHMQNFAEIAETFLPAGAAVQVSSGRELEDALIELLSDARRRGRGSATRPAPWSRPTAARKARSLDAIAELLPLAAAADGQRPAVPGDPLRPMSMLASIYAHVGIGTAPALSGARAGSGVCSGRSSASATSAWAAPARRRPWRIVARLLLEMGERPAILSRGYARRVCADGVVVVSDGRRLLRRSRPERRRTADARARRRGRPRAGVDAIAIWPGAWPRRHLGATVHVLDDGFQHLPLRAGPTCSSSAPEDVADARTLPAGRLRESLAAASSADARARAAARPTSRLARWPRASACATAFRLVRVPGEPRRLDLHGASAPARTTTAGAAPWPASRGRTRFFDDCAQAAGT